MCIEEGSFKHRNLLPIFIVLKCVLTQGAKFPYAGISRCIQAIAFQSIICLFYCHIWCIMCSRNPKPKPKVYGEPKTKSFHLFHCININVCVLIIRNFGHLVHGNVVAFLAASPPSMGTFRSCEGGIWYYGEHLDDQNNAKIWAYHRWTTRGIIYFMGSWCLSLTTC